jgi:undecaprenyl-diphosphatase
MDLWQALVLGIIEGITEYLPVSSTGHLLVAQRLMGIEENDAANAYAIAIQAGAILAVLGLYRARVHQMIRGVFGADPAGKRLAVCVVLAFMPAAAMGLAFDDAIEAYLFGPWPVVFAWIAGGIVILLVSGRLKRDRSAKALEELSWRAALVIGCAQCLALWPGTSRSFATIVGGVAAGLSLTAAVEFSFLLGLLTLGAATGYKALQHGATMLEAYGVVPVAAGFLAAWISAVLAIRWMIEWLGKNGLGLFGYWRIGAGLAVGGLLLAGLL